MYQDPKNNYSWYEIVLTCILGLAVGIIVIVKILDPFFRYVDAKLAYLLHIKKPAN
jgi:hypothetical protein